MKFLINKVTITLLVEHGLYLCNRADITKARTCPPVWIKFCPSYSCTAKSSSFLNFTPFSMPLSPPMCCVFSADPSRLRGLMEEFHDNRSSERTSPVSVSSDFMLRERRLLSSLSLWTWAWGMKHDISRTSHDPELTNYFLNIQMFRQIWSDLLATEQFYLQVISVFQVFCQAIADRTTPLGLVWLGVHLKVTFLDSSYILSWGRGTQRFPSYSAWLSKSPDVVVCRPGYMRYPFHWGSVLPESLKMGW